MEATELLVKISNILNKLKIPYIITGGMAVSVWGRPRFTADIDIVAEILPKNISLLAKELLGVDKEAIMDALKGTGEFNFIHPQSGLKVDFWVKNDRFSKQEIKRAVARVIDETTANFISPEDLILSKLLWYKSSSSTRQLEDIESVLRISKIDMDYVRKMAKQQMTLDILEELHKKIKN